MINLPDRELTVDTPDPVEGDWEWWSFYGDLLENTLTTTEPLDLSGATEAELTAQVNYDIEEGYDYLYGEVSTDGGLSWTRLNGTVDGEPIWEEGEVEGLDGTHRRCVGPADLRPVRLGRLAGRCRSASTTPPTADFALQGFFADDVVDHRRRHRDPRRRCRGR